MHCDFIILLLLVSFHIFIPSNKALLLEKLLSTLYAWRCALTFVAHATHEVHETCREPRSIFHQITRLKVRFQEHLCSVAWVHLEMKCKKASGRWRRVYFCEVCPVHHIWINYFAICMIYELSWFRMAFAETTNYCRIIRLSKSSLW